MTIQVCFMAGEVYTRVYLTKTQFCLPAHKNATANKIISVFVSKLRAAHLCRHAIRHSAHREPNYSKKWCMNQCLLASRGCRHFGGQIFYARATAVNLPVAEAGGDPVGQNDTLGEAG